MLIAQMPRVKNQQEVELLFEKLKPRGVLTTLPRMRRLFLAWATHRANQGGK